MEILHNKALLFWEWGSQVGCHAMWWCCTQFKSFSEKLVIFWYNYWIVDHQLLSSAVALSTLNENDVSHKHFVKIKISVPAQNYICKLFCLFNCFQVLLLINKQRVLSYLIFNLGAFIIWTPIFETYNFKPNVFNATLFCNLHFFEDATPSICR